MKLALITDGNGTLGMGHVYQTITLSHYLRQALGQEADLCILTTSAAPVAELLASSGCLVFRGDDERALVDFLDQIRPDRVVIDKLDVSSPLAETIARDMGIKLIILTNLSDANQYADVTVMAGMGSDFKNIRRREGKQIQLWGPRYWLIRPEFLNFPPKKLDEVRKITLIFGGADPANLSTATLAELLRLNRGYSITLILGAAFSHRTELEGVLSNHPDASTCVRVMNGTDRVAEIMRGSDLALVSPGLSFFEALLVGVPVLCFHQNSFQQDAWRGKIQTYGKEDVSSLGGLLQERRFTLPDEPKVLAMEIGEGIGEIVSEIVA